MKRILTTSAIVALMSGPVFAEAHMKEGEAEAKADTKVEATGTASYGDFAETQGMQGYRATDFIGKTIYIPEADSEMAEGELTDPAENWESVGDIGDIILSTDGQINNVIADIGGFLGMGEQQVAISMDDLDFIADGDDEDDFFLVYNGDRAMLEESEEFAWGDGAQETAEPAEANEQVADSAVVVEGDAEAETEEMAEDSEVKVEESNEEVAEVATETEPKAEETTIEAEAEMEEDKAEGVVTAGADSEAETTTTTTPAVPATGATDMAATDPANPEVQMIPVEVSSVSTDDLIGVSVVGSDDDRIGEIGELIVGDDGTINEAIIDVGGFLGIGEKPVAVSFEEIELMREGEGGPLTAQVNATEDELKGMNAYEEKEEG